MTGFELNILDFINEHITCGAADFLFGALTFLGENGYIWLAAALIMLTFKDYRKCGAAVLISLLVSALLGEAVLKPLIGRLRPFYINPVSLKIAAPRGFSFPSGHSASSFAAAVSIYLYDKRLGAAALIAAALVAFSRLYFYVHFPSDVFAGALLGAFVALGVNYAVKRRKKRNRR